MSNQQEQSVDVLNDLIQINNDRIAGYENAIEKLNEGNDDLKTMFVDFKQTSLQNIEELSHQIAKNGGEAVTDTTLLGKVYRAWMDVKNVFTGNDRESIISDCKGGEKAAQVAYDKAIADNDEITADAQQLISQQQQRLRTEQQLLNSKN